MNVYRDYCDDNHFSQKQFSEIFSYLLENDLVTFSKIIWKGVIWFTTMLAKQCILHLKISKFNLSAVTLEQKTWISVQYGFACNVVFVKNA